MLRVSQIAKRCGLSRTTILYYESCGLLRPAIRNGAGYRLYGEKEVQVAEQICLYRSLGLSVRDIRLMLPARPNDAASLLQRRLRELDSEIMQLRNHQHTILRLLGGQKILRRIKNMTKEKWVSIMRSAGLSEADMHRWHCEFERSAPNDHREFLHFLHIPEEEICSIREWSRSLKGTANE